MYLSNKGTQGNKQVGRYTFKNHTSCELYTDLPILSAPTDVTVLADGQDALSLLETATEQITEFFKKNKTLGVRKRQMLEGAESFCFRLAEGAGFSRLGGLS